MNIERPSSVSRRALLAGVGVGTFTLAARQHLAAFAQEATPVAEATPFPRFEHALNGVWEWNTDLTHNIDATPGTFYPTGAYLEYDLFNGLGLGVWRASSPQHADAVVLYQMLAGVWTSFDGPETMFEREYVPMHPEFDQRHILRYRHTLRINKAGDGLVASGVWDVFRLGDEVSVYSEQLTRRAKRMKASSS